MSIHFSAVGTIATAPKLSTSEHRAAFCTFRIACNDRRYDREQGKWIDGDTNWLTINAFRSLALHAAESFAKGDRVIVHGRLRVKQWESGEKSGVAVEVDADALGHDLRWGVSQFTKRAGAAGSETAPAPSAESTTEGSNRPPVEAGSQAHWLAPAAPDPEAGAGAARSADPSSSADQSSSAGDAAVPDQGDGFTPTLAAA